MRVGCLGQRVRALLGGEKTRLVQYIDVSRLSRERDEQFSRTVIFAFPLATGCVERITSAPGCIRTQVSSGFGFSSSRCLRIRLGAKGVTSRLTELLGTGNCGSVSRSSRRLVARKTFSFSAGASILPRGAVTLLDKVN